jgi:hypothetical protein
MMAEGGSRITAAAAAQAKARFSMLRLQVNGLSWRVATKINIDTSCGHAGGVTEQQMTTANDNSSSKATAAAAQQA